MISIAYNKLSLFGIATIIFSISLKAFVNGIMVFDLELSIYFIDYYQFYLN